MALSEGPAFDDYTAGTGQYAEQALRRMTDALLKRAAEGPERVAL